MQPSGLCGESRAGDSRRGSRSEAGLEGAAMVAEGLARRLAARSVVPAGSLLGDGAYPIGILAGSWRAGEIGADIPPNAGIVRRNAELGDRGSG